MAWKNLAEDLAEEFGDVRLEREHGLLTRTFGEAIREQRIATRDCIRCGITLHGERRRRRTCVICGRLDAQSTKRVKQKRIALGKCKNCGRSCDARLCSICYPKHLQQKRSATKKVRVRVLSQNPEAIRKRAERAVKKANTCASGSRQGAHSPLGKQDPLSQSDPI